MDGECQKKPSQINEALSELEKELDAIRTVSERLVTQLEIVMVQEDEPDGPATVGTRQEFCALACRLHDRTENLRTTRLILEKCSGEIKL
jgi:hypothetical protein